MNGKDVTTRNCVKCVTLEELGNIAILSCFNNFHSFMTSMSLLGLLYFSYSTFIFQFLYMYITNKLAVCLCVGRRNSEHGGSRFRPQSRSSVQLAINSCRPSYSARMSHAGTRRTTNSYRTDHSYGWSSATL